MRPGRARATAAVAAFLFTVLPILVVRAQAGDALRLIDVSERLGGFARANGPNNAGGLAGVAWFDYDGDSRLDLFIPNNKGHANALFRNLGNGRFRDVAGEAGVTNGLGNLTPVAGDINNDGCPDLFLVGYGGVEVDEKSPTKLYLNECDGTFRDISATAGVPGTKTSGTAAFGDVNNDGFIDLAIASAGDFQDRKDPNKLYLNNGDLTFTDISASAGIEPNLGSVDIAFVDFNKDGWQDILTDDGNDGVMNPAKGGKQFQPIPGIHRLYRNNGDLTFTDVSMETGFRKDGGFWMATAWGDYDNDSDLDHFSTSAGPFPAQDARPAPSAETFPHGFWENVGDGRFYQFKTVEAGLFRPLGSGFGWGATFADFDNDGHMDLFFHGNYPALGGLMHDAEYMGDTYGNPGYLYRNTGHKRFELVQTFGLRDRFTSGSAVGDFDSDGFPDIIVLNTAFGQDPGNPILLRNETSNGNGWITVRTVGTKSNRDGIGARVRVLAGGLTKLQEVRSGSSFASMDSPWLTFGLGTDAPDAVAVEVRWPSGRLEVFVDQPTRRLVTVVEGNGCASESDATCRAPLPAAPTPGAVTRAGDRPPAAAPGPSGGAAHPTTVRESRPGPSSPSSSEGVADGVRGAATAVAADEKPGAPALAWVLVAATVLAIAFAATARFAATRTKATGRSIR